MKPGWRRWLLGIPSVSGCFPSCNLPAGARGMGKPLCPLALSPCSPEMVSLIILWYHSDHCYTAPSLLLSVSLIQVIPVPIPSASLMHAEGPGTPQVLCLSNKVETTKCGCQAALYVELWGRVWWVHMGRGRMKRDKLQSNLGAAYATDPLCTLWAPVHITPPNWAAPHHGSPIHPSAAFIRMLVLFTP